jgi:hypothetical protein
VSHYFPSFAQDLSPTRPQSTALSQPRARMLLDNSSWPAKPAGISKSSRHKSKSKSHGHNGHGGRHSSGQLSQGGKRELTGHDHLMKDLDNASKSRKELQEPTLSRGEAATLTGDMPEREVPVLSEEVPILSREAAAALMGDVLEDRTVGRVAGAGLLGGFEKVDDVESGRGLEKASELETEAKGEAKREGELEIDMESRTVGEGTDVRTEVGIGSETETETETETQMQRVAREMETGAKMGGKDAAVSPAEPLELDLWRAHLANGTRPCLEKMVAEERKPSAFGRVYVAQYLIAKISSASMMLPMLQQQLEFFRSI